MDKNKKGTGTKPAPTTNFNYIRASRLCLFISITSLICFVIAYRVRAVNIAYLCAGTLVTSLIIHMALNPLEGENDDDYSS